MDAKFKFKRVLLKLSGEVFSGADGGFDFDLISQIASQIKILVSNGVQVAVVIGGGNILRGASQKNIDRCCADYMGMLATIINGVALQEAFKKSGLQARAMSIIPVERVCDSYIVRNARTHLDDGEVVICAGGTGAPYFTTDTNASLRASELQCDCILKATKVDGVYDCDPKKNENARRYDKISFSEAIERKLRVMDLTAMQMCMDNNIPVIIFSMSNPENVVKVLQGENIGTLVSV